jgi:hypothetical protein
MAFNKIQKKEWNEHNRALKKKQNQKFYTANKHNINLIKHILFIKTTKNINILYS